MNLKFVTSNAKILEDNNMSSIEQGFEFINDGNQIVNLPPDQTSFTVEDVRQLLTLFPENYKIIVGSSSSIRTKRSHSEPPADKSQTHPRQPHSGERSVPPQEKPKESPPKR
jgi:hypothetical protein